MTIAYYAGDERPPWQATVVVNGVTDDLSTGFTFTVKLVNSAGSVVLTKTTGIVGAAAGVVTVNWAVGDLALTAGLYTVQLTALRSADSFDWTVQDTMQIASRY